jgi:probable HAF family extracellular repeat protein
MCFGENAMERLMNRIKGIVMCAVITLSCATPAHGTSQYTFTDLGTLGGINSEGYAINNFGVVVGSSDLVADPSRQRRAFLNDGVLQNLGTLGGTLSIARGVNDSGIVVGEAWNGSGNSYAFLYDGSMHAVGNAGGFANDINNGGEIVGAAITGSRQNAFLYDGTLQFLDTANYSGWSEAQAINNFGQVIINSDVGPWIYSPGTGTTRLDTIMDPNGEWQVLSVRGINDAGVIVGSGYHGIQQFHAFMYDGTLHDLGVLDPAVSKTSQDALVSVNSSGVAVGYAIGYDVFNYRNIYQPLFYSSATGLVDLNSLADTSGWTLALAYAINDAGQITGIAHSGGSEHAFLLTPLVPEPSAMVLFSIGLSIVLRPRTLRRRR